MPKKYSLFIIFLVPFLFHSQFNKLLNEYIVLPFLVHFEQSIPNDIITILAFLLFIGLLINKWASKYLFSNFIASIFGCLFVFYSLYLMNFEFFKSDFKFKHLILIPFLRYADFVLALPFISFIAILAKRKLLVFIQNELFPKTKNINGFIPDLPLNEEQLKEIEENTTAGEFTQNLADKLLGTKSENAAFAVGISGEWGTGKTSLMKLLEKQLKEKNSENIFIDFNPWNSNSPQAIISDFFATFQEKLSEYSAEIETYINSYTNKLVNIDGYDFITTILKLSAHLFNENKSLTQEHKAINEILRKIDRQIFIFIDDLDRLDKMEIIEVIRLIRNSANFHNVFFIVAYDKGYIEQAIEGVNPHNKSFFLEKIFQLEMHIPTEEYHYILTDLHKRLVEAIPFLKENQEVENFIKSHKVLHQIIQNYRDVKRFVNSFSLVYNKKIAEETYFPDFFHAELLRFKFPLVYELLRKETRMYLIPNYEEEGTGEQIYTIWEDNNNEKQIKKYLRECSYDIFQQKRIIGLWELLFGKYEQYEITKNEHLKMKYVSYFGSYFAYRPLDNIISETLFNSIKGNISETKNYIDNGYGHEFIRKCREVAIRDKKEREQGRTLLTSQDIEVLNEGVKYFAMKMAKDFSQMREIQFFFNKHKFNYRYIRDKISRLDNNKFDQLVDFFNESALKNFIKGNDYWSKYSFVEGKEYYFIDNPFIQKNNIEQDEQRYRILLDYMEAIIKCNGNQDEYEERILAFFLFKIWYKILNHSPRSIKSIEYKNKSNALVIKFMRKPERLAIFLQLDLDIDKKINEEDKVLIRPYNIELIFGDSKEELIEFMEENQFKENKIIQNYLTFYKEYVNRLDKNEYFLLYDIKKLK